MKHSVFIIVILGVIVVTCGADGRFSNPYRHAEVLDRNGKYAVEWFADIAQSRIYFNVTVRTKGYVGLGLSRKGLMLGADIVIGGVHPNGTQYFSDRHGIANHQTQVDASQDWTLHAAWESQSHTFLSISRPFETCDRANDLPINNDVLYLIWAYGERDNVQEYHYQNRGATPVYLLDPDYTPPAIRKLSTKNVIRPQPITHLGDLSVWSIPMTLQAPVQETSYMCTFHKPPTRAKHHIVGFRTVMGEREKSHIRQLTLHICYPPKGVSADLLFSPYLGHAGEQCYLLNRLQNRMPTQYCQEIRHVWGVGSEPVFFPDHVGLPLSSSPDEYYMLQVHYDNPLQISGVKLQYSIEAFYTDKLRKHDIGLLNTGVTLPSSASILVPPSTTRQTIYGHCSAECTKKIIPSRGLQVFAGLMHTHATGTGVRALHIQNLQETVFVADDNYESSYQPVRLLREEKTLLPGDMIVDRCLYDTRNRTGATVGGHSSNNEQCNVYLWYYPLIRRGRDVFSVCTGELRSDAYRNSLQIFETSWSDDKREEIAISPPSNTGLTITEAMSRVDWDINKRTQVQTHHRFLPQVSSCPSYGPDAVTESLYKQSGQRKRRRSPLLTPAYLQVQEDALDLGTFTYLNKELTSPGNEFVSLWPKDLSFYSPPTICPAT